MQNEQTRLGEVKLTAQNKPGGVDFSLFWQSSQFGSYLDLSVSIVPGGPKDAEKHRSADGITRFRLRTLLYNLGLAGNFQGIAR